MGSLGAKKAVACPSGEQFVNGGFETGGFTGWNVTGAWAVTTYYLKSFNCASGGILIEIYPAEGSYFSYIDNTGAGSVTGVLEQDFASPIPVQCFTDASVFSVTMKHDGCEADPCSPGPGPSVWKVEILYTDGTSTTVDCRGDPIWYWTTHNLKTVLVPGKTVKGIKITATIPQWIVVGVDGCTLKI
jgi:hypothetical protein